MVVGRLCEMGGSNPINAYTLWNPTFPMACARSPDPRGQLPGLLRVYFMDTKL